MTRKPRSLNAAKHHDQLEMIASLNNALATGDTAAFVKTIGDQLRIQGMTNISQKTGLNRTTLYISFRGNVMPNIDRVVPCRAQIRDRHKADLPILIILSMSAAVRPQKITFGEMRESGVLIYCADGADPWPDDEAIGSSCPRKRRQRRREDFKEHPGEEEEKQHMPPRYAGRPFRRPAWYNA